jgi:inner membrane protein involved in colicin E2 resistance
VDEDINVCGKRGGWKMPITMEIESVNVKPGARVSQLFLDVHLQVSGKLSNGQEINMPIVFNLFGSHSPPLAANTRNGRQNTPPLAAGIVYFKVV